MEDWYNKQIALHGKREAECMLSRLTVKKSKRHYNDPIRILPGAVFIYNGKCHVLSGRLSNGKYFRAVGDSKTNYPVGKCMIVKQNEGLVFVY